MPLTLQTHQYEKIPGQGTQVRLARVVPYLRIRHSQDPPVFVQKGGVYTEGGEEANPLPEWFWGEARKCNPAARAEVGLVLPEEKEAPQTAPPPPGDGFERLPASKARGRPRKVKVEDGNG